MEFKSYYKNRPKSVPEINSGKRLTESAGYISAERRITELIKAGQRLDDFRKLKYDTDKDEELPIDPTRKKSFDLADASRINEELKLRMEYAKKASKKAVAGSEKTPPSSDPLKESEPAILPKS